MTMFSGKAWTAWCPSWATAHTRVLSPSQYAFHKDKQSKTLGLSLAELDGDIVVMSVETRISRRKSGHPKGQSPAQH